MPDPKLPLRIPKKVDSQTTFNIYCNSAQLGLTPWDVRMEFNELLGTGSQQEEVILLRHGTVVMSPAHAKVLMKALTETIAKYESNFGYIDTTRIEEVVNQPQGQPQT